MSDINSLTITGRLTKDALRKTFPGSGSAFLEFDIANNTGFGDYAKVNYFKCMLLGDKRADSLLQYLNKGQLVGITGELESNNWTGQDGKMRYDWKLKVSQLSLLGGSKGQNGGTGQSSLGFDDDLDKQLKEDANKRYMDHGKKEVTF